MNIAIAIEREELDSSVLALTNLGFKEDMQGRRFIEGHDLFYILIYPESNGFVLSNHSGEYEIQGLSTFVKTYTREGEVSIEKAKQTLKNAGYFMDNLWSVRDVINVYSEEDGSKVTKEKAYEILKYTLENPFMIEYINEHISFVAVEKTFNLINNN